MDLYDRHVGPLDAHGNQQLHLRGLLGTLLASAFEPAVRSLRTIDDLSLYPEVQAVSGVKRVARSTASDALKKFDPKDLLPMIAALHRQTVMLERHDPETDRLTKHLIAADGSYFNLAGKVAHAMQCRRGNGPALQSRIRLNLQIDVDSMLPTDLDVSGAGDGSEAKALMRHLHSDCVYLMDRNFIHFGLLNAILARQSSFVLRLKKNTLFAVQRAAPLCDKDAQHNVLRDEIGCLSGPVSAGNDDARSCSDQPPAQLLRRVTLWDEDNQREMTLITDVLDVPAYIIGLLYRLRWQIELFLRWLKVLAGFEHLISQSEHGMTMQFYVAVIMTLLIHIHSGHRRVSKYSLMWVSWIAQGRATPEMMAPAMARHERERMLERARREKKKRSI